MTRAQLRGFGLSDSAVTRLVRTGRLNRVHRGVYLVGGAPFTDRARMWSACQATGAVLGFATAAHLWGYLDEQPALLDLVLEPGRRVRAPPGARLRRVFLPRSAVVVHEGLPVSNRTWSLLDHLGSLPPSAAGRLADRAFQRGWLRPTDVERRLREFPGRTGNAMLRRLLAQAADGAAAESERKLHRLLRGAHVTGWVANYAVCVDGRVVAVVDVAFVGSLVAVEVDGWAYHSDVDRFRHDRWRQNLLISLGWTVLRFTWADLTERPEYVLHTIVECSGR